MINFRHLIVAVLLSLFTVGAMAITENQNSARGVVTNVEGTNLARLQRAVDVLYQIPNVEVAEDQIKVAGRGLAAVYIDQRRVVNLSDLWILPASRIQSVTVNAAPGAIYDHDVQAVIVITLIRDMAEGLRFDNNFRFDLNTHTSFSDRLALGYRYKNVNLSALIAFDQKREHVHKTSFEHDYAHAANDRHVLQKQVETYTQPINRVRTLTAHLALDYDLASNQQLRLKYATYQTLHNTSYGNNARRLEYSADSARVIDFNHPLIDLAQQNRQRTPEQYHDLIAEYQGEFGNWKLFAGNNSVWKLLNNYAKTYRPVPNLAGDEDFLRRKLNMRNYLRATTTLPNGNLSLGAEHQYSHANIMLKDYTKINNRTHGKMDATTLAAFVTVDQKIGIVEFEAGLRYENVDFRYRALPDDEYLQASSYTSFRFGHKDDFFYPNAAVKLQLGKSSLALRYVRSQNKPNMENIRILVADTISPDKYMIFVERISTTSLTWQYDWLTLSAAYKHFSDPIFNTTDGKVDYTGKCYDGLDLGVDLTPTIGIWKPALSFHCHKQWLNMRMLDGNEHANDPCYNFHFNNTVALKSNWLFRLNAQYRSKGFDRNVRYYDDNFQLDASVAKDFCNNHLSVEATVENILRNSWNDVTIYGNCETLVSKGYRQRVPRLFSVSLRYKF